MTTALEDLDQWLSDMPAHWYLRDKVKRLRDKVKLMHDVLEDCAEYFDKRADAATEGDPSQWLPNEEMRLLSAIEKVAP